MGRYDNHSGSGTGSGNANYDDTTLKLQKYAAVRLTPTKLNFSSHQKYGDSLIANFDDGVVLDGIVLQREDKPGTWKLFGFGDMGFNVGDDGKVYERYDADAEEYTDELSAEDILEHARIQGFSESFGGDKYWYKPVGVVIEEADDVVISDDLVYDPDDYEDDDEEPNGGLTEEQAEEGRSNTTIPIGETTIMVGNKSWVRSFAKLVSETGSDIIETEINDEGNEVPVGDDHGWLTTNEPELREGIEGREVELFVIEETFTPDGSDEEETYSVPVLLDSKTGQRITIDNDADGDGEDQSEEGADAAEPAAVADGGATTADSAETDTESPESTENADAPDGVPDELDELIGYFARTQDGDVTPEEFKDFAEVDDPDSVDWEAACEAAKEQAEGDE